MRARTAKPTRQSHFTSHHVLPECSQECRGRVYYVTPRLLGSYTTTRACWRAANFNLSSLQTSSYLSLANKGEGVISPARRGRRSISHRRRNVYFVRNICWHAFAKPSGRSAALRYLTSLPWILDLASLSWSSLGLQEHVQAPHVAIKYHDHVSYRHASAYVVHKSKVTSIAYIGDIIANKYLLPVV